MKAPFILISCYLVFSILSSCSDNNISDIEKIDWLTGEWMIQKKDHQIIEIWKKENKKQYFGSSFQISEQDSILIEKMRRNTCCIPSFFE